MRAARPEPFGPSRPGTHLALAPLLPAEDQRDLAKTAIGAFLEASLHGDDRYRGLFMGRPTAGALWIADVALEDGGAGTLAPRIRADGP